MPKKPPALSSREVVDRFETLLAGGAKTRLLESFLDFDLTTLLARGPLSPEAIAAKLALHPLRARKWLHLLSLIGLLEESSTKANAYSDSYRYALSPLARDLFAPGVKEAPFYKDKVFFWRQVAVLDFNTVLRGLPLPAAVRWPPRTLEAAKHLEWWMSVTASKAAEAIEKAVDLEKARKMLDAGGGDGTMACAFARSHPKLGVTVFNLPNSAYLARNKIAEEKATGQVKVVEGDFLAEPPLPGGFDLVLWARVFSDWPVETVRQLMQKSHAALVPGGQLVICEPMLDGNEDLTIAWEFRYLFYDDFRVALFKKRATYEQLLRETGFQPIRFVDRGESSIYSVIVAKRPPRRSPATRARR